ncbi:MAG: hypothetical protein ACLFQV_11300, partial [Vulcanimicrobiota bacterium]
VLSLAFYNPDYDHASVSKTYGHYQLVNLAIDNVGTEGMGYLYLSNIGSNYPFLPAGIGGNISFNMTGQIQSSRNHKIYITGSGTSGLINVEYEGQKSIFLAPINPVDDLISFVGAFGDEENSTEISMQFRRVEPGRYVGVYEGKHVMDNPYVQFRGLFISKIQDAIIFESPRPSNESAPFQGYYLEYHEEALLEIDRFYLYQYTAGSAAFADWTMTEMINLNQGGDNIAFNLNAATGGTPIPVGGAFTEASVNMITTQGGSWAQ